MIYNIPDSKSSRHAALGYGKKTTFTDNTPKTPGPGTYANPSLFRSKSESNFGITMGYGRQVIIISSLYCIFLNIFEFIFNLNKRIL